jgi:hypothetical protein
MWLPVDLVWTDVSEERTASIFRVKKSASDEPAWEVASYTLRIDYTIIFPTTVPVMMEKDNL